MVTLPRYIVEKQGSIYAIWDTVEHEYTGFEYPTKIEASEKAAIINNIKSFV